MSASRKRRPGYYKDYYAQNRFKLREAARLLRATIKAAVLTFYGGGKMQCVWPGCEVSDPDMLTIDHVNNDGAQDRKIDRGGHDFYRRLQVKGYPEGFQTLCANHQLKKEIQRRTNIFSIADAFNTKKS